jgi:aminocarboxymuconate-semialdehyde decarboxylase
MSPMTPLIDVHCHVAPSTFPRAPHERAASQWPCMHATGSSNTLMIGDRPFRELDDRSWATARRLEDMDRDGVAIQVLSPMPELLSYWLDPTDAEQLCMHSNEQIARMIASAPGRFRGLGAVPLQDPERAARLLPRLRREFALSGVEIGSNIGGEMLGNARFDPFFAAAQEEGMAIFVHALHPVAAKAVAVSATFSALALFPLDVAMGAASLITEGALERFPRLRIGFSHGGGALGAILGRLDQGWRAQGSRGRSPSEQARTMFFDSNVYDATYLRCLASEIVPGRVFLGTDYPYPIMQRDPAVFVDSIGLNEAGVESIRYRAALTFLGEGAHRSE